MQTKKIVTLFFSIMVCNAAQGMIRKFEFSPFLLQATEEAEGTDDLAMFYPEHLVFVGQVIAQQEVNGPVVRITDDFTKVKTVKRIRNKTPKEISYCDECIFFTKYASCMKSHRAAHAKMKISPNLVRSCQQCGYLTDRQYLLKDHVKTHQDERNYHCKKCFFVGKSNYSLKQHIHSEHPRVSTDVL